MGRILDFFSRLEAKRDRPADPGLLLTDEDDGEGEAAGPESKEQRKARSKEIRRQRSARSVRWGRDDR